MGYIFRYEDAQRYEEWFKSEAGRSATKIEMELLQRIWSPRAPERVLEVGCGSGIFLEWLARAGHQVSGIDPSPAMLDIARRRLSSCVSLDRGYAEHLPYENNAFDTVALITTLEFVDDPLLALREACRVARNHVLLGALNRYSLTGWQRILGRYVKRKPSVFNRARFFDVLELHCLVERALSGRVPIKWRTCLSLPLWTLPYLQYIERSRYLQWHPFGHFIGMRVDMRYQVQTIQEPLFCDLPSGVGHARLHIPCLRLSEREVGRYAPGGDASRRSQPWKRVGLTMGAPNFRGNMTDIHA